MCQHRNTDLKISSIVRRFNIFGFLIFTTIAINLFLTTLPLTNTLGYEFSVINAILLFLCSGFLGINMIKKGDSQQFISILQDNKNSFLLLIVLPFLISLISSLIVAKCPITDGIFFYLAITVPASFFGFATGFFSYVLSKRYAFLFFLLFFFLMFLSTAHEFFVNPQIYFYNPIFGFFPGTIYDEDLSVDRILIAYRIFNIAFFIGLVTFSEHLFFKSRINKLLSSLLLIVIIGGFSYLKPTLYFSTDLNRLESNLNRFVNTESFQIHFPASTNEDEVRYAAILHEYYLDQIKINLELKENFRIDSYIYEDRNQKRILLGAGSANIAKPWLRQIYLNSSSYEESLKHELIHVVGGEFGTTPLKVAENFNPSMIEGLAMAIENNYDGNPVHYMAKLAFQADYKIPIETLFSGLNFFNSTSSISYIYSGSFIKFLSEKYGVDKIKLLYANSDFKQIFGKNLSALAVEYIGFVENYRIDFNRYKAQLYFGGTTIFKKFCPRVAAAEVKKAWGLYDNRKTAEALVLFQKIFSYSNSYQSLSGMLACYIKQKKYLEAKKFLSQQLPNFKSSPYYFYLELAYGDLYIKCDERKKAVEIYDSLLVQNPHVQYTNEILIRKTILDESIDSLKKYFSMNETLKYQKLLRMNEKDINYFSIPSLLQHARRNNFASIDFVKALKRKFIVTDLISSYAALETSKYALKKANYETAQYFAILAMNYKQDENLNHPYIENLRAVNWFKNNAEELKLTFKKRQ